MIKLRVSAIRCVSFNIEVRSDFDPHNAEHQSEFGQAAGKALLSDLDWGNPITALISNVVVENYGDSLDGKSLDPEDLLELCD